MFFPVRILAAAYTDIFRGIPLIIVLYLIGFGIPPCSNQRVPLIVLGTVAITITYSAYVSEVIRAGIEAVHPSQRHRGPRDRAQLHADPAAGRRSRRPCAR